MRQKKETSAWKGILNTISGFQSASKTIFFGLSDKQQILKWLFTASCGYARMLKNNFIQR